MNHPQQAGETWSEIILTINLTVGYKVLNSVTPIQLPRGVSQHSFPSMSYFHFLSYLFSSPSPGCPSRSFRSSARCQGRSLAFLLCSQPLPQCVTPISQLRLCRSALLHACLLLEVKYFPEPLNSLPLKAYVGTRSHVIGEVGKTSKAKWVP
jgi:hypothetical protein